MDKKYELFDGHYANEEQVNAIDKIQDFLENETEKDQFTLIGRGGTGKTTILKKVLAPFINPKNKVAIAAPSHAAKQVLEKSFIDFGTKITSYTVASLLGMKLNVRTNKFEIDKKSRQKHGIPIERFNIIIIDEASMIDESLKSYILKFKKSPAKIIFVGDSAQLPPIREERSMFSDKDSPVFDVPLQAKLVKRMRQGEDSHIVPITDVFALNIDRAKEGGRISPNPLSIEKRITNFNAELNKGVIFENDPLKTIESFITDLTNPDEENNPNNAKIIVYTNDLRQRINTKVREELWGKEKDQFMLGEKVVAFSTWVDEYNSPLIHNSDNYVVTKISKGSVGRFKALWLTLVNDYTTCEVPVLAYESFVDFESEKTKRLEKAKRTNNWKGYYSLLENFADIQYGYAISSHKAQGSTFKNVYVFEDNIMGVFGPSTKTKNQSMYVAVSRPSDKLVIYSKNNPK